MSNERDIDQTVTVSRGEVTVEKGFEPDEFPVPAVTFRIQSESDEPVDVRLVDEIPEDFPMSAIGFHPEFESDNWTAYKDHRVEFERTLEPGEELKTVYGVRLDREEDALNFLGEPELAEVGSEGESVEEIIGEDRNQPVRDVLAGERESLPGLTHSGAADGDIAAAIGGSETEVEEGATTEPEAEATDVEPGAEVEEGAEAEESAEVEGGADSTAESGLTLGEPGSTGEPETEAPAPREFSPDVTPAVVQRPPDAPALGADVAEVEVAEEEAEAVEVPEEEAEAVEAVEETPVAEATEAEAAPESGRALPPESVAAVLAQELREGSVSEADQEVLREELDLGVPRSVDVRIKRLQSSVSDLQAYSDALEEFLDEEGSAREIIDDFRTEVDDLSDTVEELQEDLSDADADRAELQGEVEELETSLGETATRVENLSSDLTATGSRVTTLDEEIGDIREDMATLDRDVVDLEEDLDEDVSELREDLDEEISDVRADVDDVRAETRDDVEEIREQLSDIHGEIEELDEFRERLNQAFGGGMGGQSEE